MKQTDKPSDIEIQEFYESCGFQQKQWEAQSTIRYYKERGESAYYWQGTNWGTLMVGGFVPPIDIENLLTRVVREISEALPEWTSEGHYTMKPSGLFALLVRWNLAVQNGAEPALALFRVIQEEVSTWYTKKQSWMEYWGNEVESDIQLINE